MPDVTIISGTDPTNPRCARDIVDRLRQIERDTMAMRHEARRLYMFAGSVRSVLLSQGRGLPAAQSSTDEVVLLLKRLADRLDAAMSTAGIAVGVLEGTGVNMTTRFSDVHQAERGRR